MTEVRAGDWLRLVRHVDEPVEGEVLEVLEARGAPHVRVRGPEGHELLVPIDTPGLELVPRPDARRRPGRDDPRAFVLEYVPRGSVGAEIGVWRGDFSHLILEVVEPQRLHLIDPWRFMPDERHAQTKYGGVATASQEDMDSVFADVVERFRHEIESGQVVVHREDAARAALRFTPGELDWIYVDGDHNYEAVSRDIRLLGERVARGGLVLGDDFTHQGWWGDSVVRAVDDYVASGRAEFVLVERTQYVLRRT